MTEETILALLGGATEDQLGEALNLALRDEDNTGYHSWKPKYNEARRAFESREWNNKSLVFLLSRATVSTDFLLLFE